MTALRRLSIKGKWQRPSTGKHLGRQVWFGNRDDTTCLIHDFYRVARPVGGGTARRGHCARGIVASLDPTAPCPHRVFAGEGVVLWTRLRPVHGWGSKRLILFEGRIEARTGDVLHATRLYWRSHEHLLMLESFRERVEEGAACPGARERVIKRLLSAVAFYIDSDVVRVVAVI